MNFGEWQAKLYDRAGTMSIDLWLFRRINKTEEVLTHKGEIKTLKEGTAPDFDDYFVRFESYDQLKTVADAFADFGVKDKNDYKNAGLLEAKDAHLQDMRTLAFKLIDQAGTQVITAASPDSSQTEGSKNANKEEIG